MKAEKDGKLTAESVWREYEKMLDYNAAIQLDDTVRVNENFFVGRQWEGVESNGLPTPVFNFLKRVTLFTVASITSERIKLRASPVDAASGSGEAHPGGGRGERGVRRALRAQLACPRWCRSSCATPPWTATRPPTPTGTARRRRRAERRGAIRTEIVANTRVGFGNSADRRVQSQPYILIKKRELTEKLRERAKALGCREWEDIRPDTDEQYADRYKETGDKTTVILRLWKERLDGHGLGLRVLPRHSHAPGLGPGAPALSRDLALLGLCAGLLSRPGDAHGADTEPDLHQQALRHDDDFAHDDGLPQGRLRPHARAQVGQRHRPGHRRQRRGRQRAWRAYSTRRRSRRRLRSS